MSRFQHSEHEEHPIDGLLASAVVNPVEIARLRDIRRARRRVQRRAAFVIAFVVVSATIALIAQVAFTNPEQRSGAAPAVAVRGEAVAVTVIRPGMSPERIAVAAPIAPAQRREVAASARFAIDTAGSVAIVERARTEAAISSGARSATSAATIERIALFGERVVITGAGIEATAASAKGRASGSVELGVGTKVLVDGVATEASANRQIAVEGIGTVLLNEQAVLAAAPTGDAQTGPRYRIVGAIAHVRLTQRFGDLPAGTQVIIGRVDAGIREGKIREVARPTSNPAAPAPAPGTSPVPGLGGGVQAGAPRPGDASLPRVPVAVRAGAGATTALRANLQNYVFPILGKSSYSDTWGAARASTGVPHQGTDIFAAEGTPIVAVADGVLDRVGWNSIGGYRFWLHDAYGNSFYHAHLSAYSPLARDGARVRAGDVIGFVGHTGDAQGTPDHVHFEVHPGNGAAVNPIRFLDAWRKGIAVAIGLVSGGESKTAALALLSFSDISANSGLGESVLESVPDNHARPIEDETSPVPTDESLKGAINGAGISG